jgi:hypothetical protein
LTVPTYHILNLGAGVQSTTLYLMSHRQDEPELVPRFDFAIFADTQEEPRAVYEHLAWLKSLGGPPIIEATAGKLGDDLARGMNSTGQRFTSIPAFTLRPDGTEGIIRRQCTSEYKVKVIESVIRRQILGLPPRGRVPGDVRVIQYLGLSFDEPGRVARVMGRFRAKAWTEARFPLYDLEMTRMGCLAYLERTAPEQTVPRSACVFCPYHRNDEWRRIRDHDPDGWQRACEVDAALRVAGNVANRGLDQALFLHRSCKPLEEAPIDTPESRGEQYLFGFAQECEGMCGI